MTVDKKYTIRKERSPKKTWKNKKSLSETSIIFKIKGTYYPWLLPCNNKNQKLYILARITTLQEIISGDKMPKHIYSPILNTGYVPYFYESGRFYFDNVPGKKAHTSSYSHSTYDFTSDLIKSQPTVEDIIRAGYFAIPKSEPEIAIISDKKHTSGLGLDDVIHQVRSRNEIYQKNIYDLEIAKCAAINSMFEHEANHGPADSQIEYSLNKRLDRLYKDQREERINLWQDISRLKLILPENAQNYLSAYRKVSILEDKNGDDL
jgi:hypothetical protein